MNVAKQLGLVGKVDAALSDWSSPSFEWSVLLSQHCKVLRPGGVVYIRHVKKAQYSDEEVRRMKMSMMSGGSYPQAHGMVNG